MQSKLSLKIAGEREIVGTVLYCARLARHFQRAEIAHATERRERGVKQPARGVY